MVRKRSKQSMRKNLKTRSKKRSVKKRTSKKTLKKRNSRKRTSRKTRRSRRKQRGGGGDEMPLRSRDRDTIIETLPGSRTTLRQCPPFIFKRKKKPRRNSTPNPKKTQKPQQSQRRNSTPN